MKTIKSFISKMLGMSRSELVAISKRQTALDVSINAIREDISLLTDELRGKAVSSDEFKPIGNTVYILATGPSIEALNSAEIDYLSSQTTIAMNRYLIFWNRIGVWPTFYFLGDRDKAAPAILREVRRALIQESRPCHFLLDEYHRPSAPIGCQVTFFRRLHKHIEPKRWARTLEEELFFWRGSLTCLINLVDVLWPGTNIKLIGVDLNKPGGLANDEINRRPELQDPANQVGDTKGMHITAVDYAAHGGGSMLDAWPYLIGKVRQHGGDIVCCNPESLLVTKGLCVYEPIISDDRD